MASDEELRKARSEAAGHAYVAAFNEAADDLSQQELAYERRSHAQTMARLRAYEVQLTYVAMILSGSAPLDREALAVQIEETLNDDRDTQQRGATR
jgi:hypothetical protein